MAIHRACSLLMSFMALFLLVSSKLTVHVVTHSHLDAGWIYDLNRCYLVV